MVQVTNTMYELERARKFEITETFGMIICILLFKVM